MVTTGCVGGMTTGCVGGSFMFAVGVVLFLSIVLHSKYATYKTVKPVDLRPVAKRVAEERLEVRPKPERSTEERLEVLVVVVFVLLVFDWSE